MRGLHLILCVTVALAFPSAARAADALKFGPPAAWVVPAAIPATANAPADAPIAVLLADQQIAFEPGKTTTYAETAIKIQTSQGLAAGNISIPWNPANDTVTVHKLHIRRGDRVIDVLGSGQTFTTLRREANLEAAMLDGRLTANIQPEGLQEGDVIVLAMSFEHADPVMKGHVEAFFGTWNNTPMKFGRARLIWPKAMPLKLKFGGGLAAAKPAVRDGSNILELTQQDIEPILAPKGAPPRFALGRLGEASDFDSWADIADLMGPLYRQAAVIPASGPLRDEVERIRKEASDPVTRTEKALALVQERVRYVALTMGEGGYVPATAESSWSRRFGDCKAKTALLLAILHEFGIEAEPVAVSSRLGDGLNEHVPMVSLFDHVLVRARIDGRTYWLDGTRTGDTRLADIQTPAFRWGLPLVPRAELVAMMPPPLAVPDTERTIEVDARAGVYASAPVTIEEIYRGDSAIELNAIYSQVTAAQKNESLRTDAKRYLDTITIKDSSIAFDKSRKELRTTIKGEAKLKWDDGWFHVPASSIGYEPDFERRPGPGQDAPLAVSYPNYSKTRVLVRLPAGFLAAQNKPPPAVKETLAGVEYVRTVSLEGDMLKLDAAERALVPEVAYKEAIAHEARLRAIEDQDIYLRVPSMYKATQKDIVALSSEKPTTANQYFVRAGALLANKKFDEAMADLAAGLALEPRNAWALAKRAAVQISKQRLAEGERDLRAAEAIEPNNSDVMAVKGDLAAQRGDYNSALEAYGNAIRQDPTNHYARVRRAVILLQQDKRDGALADVMAVLAAEPRNLLALTQRAQIHAANENWAAADADVATALAADPADALALATKAWLAMQRSDYKTALDLVSRSLESDPDNSFARSLRAQLLKREGNADEAERTLSEAIALSPKDVSARLSRAFSRLQAKEFDGAEEDITAALAIEPTNPHALYARGQLAMARGDHKAAVDALTAGLNAAPSSGPMLERRAEAYRELRKYDLALADTEAALKTGVFAPSLRLLRFNILLQQGELGRAGEEADLLVKENPSSEFALVAAGKAYTALGMRDKAMTSFDRALALGRYAYIYVNRAQVRPYVDTSGKLSDLDAALKIEPHNPDAMAEKARLLSRQGKHSEAIELFDRAIAAALDGSYLELGRAIALHKAGRLAEAGKAFDAERSKAKSASDFNRLCAAKARQDVLLESAFEDCREALRKDAGYWRANENLGLVLLKLGRLDQALAAYDEAVAKKTGAYAYMGRAMVHARMGDMERSRTDAAAARKLRPDIDDDFAEYGLSLDKAATTAIDRPAAQPPSPPKR
jgi:tetratricopeptide (TPR) repeat protein